MTKTQWVELGIYPVMNCNDKDSDDLVNFFEVRHCEERSGELAEPR